MHLGKQKLNYRTSAFRCIIIVHNRNESCGLWLGPSSPKLPSRHMQIRRFEKETFYYGYNGNDSDSTLIVVIGTIERYYYYIV